MQHNDELRGIDKTEYLTARECEIVSLVACGLTNRQIAEQLTIATSTVERHIANILGKLGLHSRIEIAIWAVEQGHVAPGEDRRNTNWLLSTIRRNEPSPGTLQTLACSAYLSGQKFRSSRRYVVRSRAAHNW